MKKFSIDTFRSYLIECSIISSETAFDESTSLESLHMDSLDGAQIFMKIEEDYQVLLPFSVYSEKTIGDLIRNIEEVIDNVYYKKNRTD